MAIHPHLDGITLDVAYRGSLSPQTVDVGVELAGPAELPLAPWAIGSLVDCINHGLAGGSDFAPNAGSAKLEAGPTGQGPAAPDELGPKYAFRLTVAGVSPRFVRVLVENLAASGHPSAVKTISVVGSLPTDISKLSVRERELADWLDDPNAYPAAWPTPGFAVVTKPIPRGATVNVTLARGDMNQLAPILEETLSAWQSAVLTYPTAALSGRGVMDPHAAFARTRTELRAKVSLFDHVRGPARAALINALTWFHETIAPLARVEIAMP
jgi:hypothetical protein